MVEDSIKQATMELQKGNLIILFDDMLHNAGYLMGVADNVSAPNIDQMTKIAKGLTYVCMPEEKARKLELPLKRFRLMEERSVVLRDSSLLEI